MSVIKRTNVRKHLRAKPTGGKTIVRNHQRTSKDNKRFSISPASTMFDIGDDEDTLAVSLDHLIGKYIKQNNLREYVVVDQESSNNSDGYDSIILAKNLQEAIVIAEKNDKGPSNGYKIQAFSGGISGL